MATTLEQRCRQLVANLSIGPPDCVTGVVPLTGGVASDIAAFTLCERRYCAKFALAKLKVAEDWRAPVHRNRAEYEWLRAAASIVPDSAVKLYGRSESLHGFAMEFIAGDDVYLWKSALLAGRGCDGEAERVGDRLGRIHAASARPGFDTSPFHNRDDFRAIRIEPYLTFTATRQPDVAAELNALADMLYRSDHVLVHGDVSPKNIMLRGGHPIVLDAECATMGDASFDPAFCLNHLFLKAVHMPGQRAALLAAVSGFWAGYAPHVHWEPVAALEARICRLLPALMLARIDGKSPVEYLSEAERERVRELARPLIRAPAASLAGMARVVADRMEEQDR